ncbi:MAG TPA: phosphotransferase [Methylomirabilota bacterium]|jgi:aminoglycoside/choline kinase family phosphotransferase|nr:phosphotransferase [Methylomirabilota bacterium]
MTPRDGAIARFLARAGWGDAARAPLAGDASFRRYDRVRLGRRSAVLMDAPPPLNDVRPFLAVDRLLRAHGLSAPEILAEDAEAGLVLLEDLGDATYGRVLAEGGDEAALYRLAVDALIHLHGRFRPNGGPLSAFDEARALREVELLLDWLWPAMMGAAASDGVRAAYREAWRAALPARESAPSCLALFDFHIDNLMWLKGRPGIKACGLLDFQDAVLAPVTFDLVSLLEDARRDVPAALAEQLIGHYLAAFPEIREEDFRASYCVIGAQRSTRILGTFARLKLRDSKPGYLAHIPRVWRWLGQDLAHPALAPVRAWFDRHIPPERRTVPEALRA